MQPPPTRRRSGLHLLKVEAFREFAEQKQYRRVLDRAVQSEQRSRHKIGRRGRELAQTRFVCAVSRGWLGLGSCNLSVLLQFERRPATRQIRAAQRNDRADEGAKELHRALCAKQSLLNHPSAGPQRCRGRTASGCASAPCASSGRARARARGRQPMCYLRRPGWLQHDSAHRRRARASNRARG